MVAPVLTTTTSMPVSQNANTAQLSLMVFWGFISAFCIYARFIRPRMTVYSAVRLTETDAEEGIQESTSAEGLEEDIVPHTKVNNLLNMDKLMPACEAMATFGVIMVFFFITDYKKWTNAGERIYDRDIFICVNVIALIIGLSYTVIIDPKQSDVMLSRNQTEEWKGIMQMVFVLYHYYNAGVDVYNIIRVFIACYVWMTGFGNFLYFYKRNDFSAVRLLKMLFRLNFLVFFVCWVLDTEYMLYYICPMHTFYFLIVYVVMIVKKEKNQESKWMCAKFVVLFSVLFATYDIAGVGETLFTPAYFLLSYEGSLHEWIFRSGLDHYIPVVGMLCAYNYDRIMNFLPKRGEEVSFKTLSIISVCSTMLLFWFTNIQTIPKREYNAIHPYTSVIPVCCYIVLRNLTPWLRERHMELFAWGGRITLETYLCQFHIWLQSNAKGIIVWVPGYPMINFLVGTFIYVFLAHTLFRITNILSEFLFPNDLRQILNHFIVFSLMMTASLLVVLGYQMVLT
eukprot:CFRG5794T1